MRKRLTISALILCLTTLDVIGDPPNEKMPDDDNDLYKNETLESCYAKTVSAYIQSCLIYLEYEKKKVYTATFNDFMKRVAQDKKYFFDYNLFVKLIKKTKLDWDRFIKNECLAEATTLQKDGFGYSYAYNRCLILGYESRIQYYKDYDF